MGGSRAWRTAIGGKDQQPNHGQTRMSINWGKYNPIKLQYVKERKPQKLWLELLGKSYVGLIYWTALVEFVRNLFWFQLKAGGLAPQLGFLAYLFMPSIAVGRPFFRYFLEIHPWSRALLIVGGVLGLLAQLQSSAVRRLTLSACGVGFLGIYVWEGMWAATTARRERTAFGMVGGILLLQVLQWAYAGPNPLVARWWGLVFLVMIPGVCSALLVLCEDLAESEGEELQSFIEEEEDIELDQVEQDESDEWRFSKLDIISTAGRLSNGHEGNGTGDLGKPVGYISLSENSADGSTTSTGTGSSRRQMLRSDVKLQDQVSNSEEFGKEKVQQALENKGTLEIVETSITNTSINDTFQTLSWGFGEEAFREARTEIDERGAECADLHAQKIKVILDGLQADGSPMKRTRRAQLIDESFNSVQSNALPKSISSPKWISSPMKNKRWGEGEEVPWLMDIRGDHDISESELDPYRHKDMKWNIGSCMRTAQMGIGSGSLLFLTHWILTAPTSLPRWQGLSAEFGWVSIFSLIFGLVAATEYPRMRCLRYTQGPVFLVIAAAGASLFMWSGTGTMVGGALLAFSGPSLWISIAQCNLEKYPGGGLAIMVLVYIALVLWSTSLVAYQFIPALSFLRGTRGILMGCALTGIGLGVAREPSTASKERAAHGGKWRGLFTSEIDTRGRQAVGAMIAVVGIIAAIAFGVRLQHASTEMLTSGSLKVLNFNVQQGFSRAGTVNYDSVLSILRDEQPHFVMLQETDMMHIAHGNLDMVDPAPLLMVLSEYVAGMCAFQYTLLFYLGCFWNGDQIDYWSTWLTMHSLYTPPTKSDTWGCALLSYYPFIYAESGVLSSPKGENACYQYAQVKVAGEVVHLVNTHSGISGDEIILQSQQLGAVVRGILDQPGKEKVWLLLGGDFNAAPLSLSYNTTISSGLVDAYVSRNGEWNGPWERDPGAGYIFSSISFNCTSWSEPQYDQQKSADGFPIVATFEFT